MEETKVINKLILIGNGFDLSMGLKTKYEDFLLWYFKDIVAQCLGGVRQTRLRTTSQTVYHYYDDEMIRVYSHYNIFMDHRAREELRSSTNSIIELKEFLKNYEFFLEFKSTLLKQIYYDSNRTWVDIEGAYFKLLKKQLPHIDLNQINKLNSDLKIISEKLREYLSSIEPEENLPYIQAIRYVNQFLAAIDSNEIIDSKKEIAYKTKIYYFVNFNYTNTLLALNDYLKDELEKQSGRPEYFISHIHGILSEDNLIFGYGDEMDKDYNKIEEAGENALFENIKSFKYFERSEYRNLLRFINSEDYQISIYGHSCGLSDRLLLNEVFEHDNCKSIKIYYYNKQEYIQKTMDISRHFNNNQIMRQKIVEFNENDKIPQVN